MRRQPRSNPGHAGRRERGFTLLEIMVVLGILGVLFGTLFAVYTSTLDIAAQVDAAEERGRAVRTTLSLLESDLAGIYLQPRENGTEPSREYALRTGESSEDVLSEGMERTLLGFATTNTLEFSTRFPKGSVSRVRYLLRAKGEKTEPSTLVRLQQRFPGLGGGWTEIELADDVLELNFSFVDDKGIESSEWGTQESSPDPVQVTALLVLGTGEGQAGKDRHSITVPLALR
jgi:type II secretion system protein J